ncbi:hypothetical protein [Mesorhizobium sp.]|uniref:hypothetical protein n=1 Tax=Mesorhizobium sp. TaxID=1871066 RepID=UPI000FE96CBF|nr:hypothetical protein [Mesorhizobium sp.]RWB66571.1 MAG: hypothetical protein EOQ49_28175 [Mesorhizobium sp.]
MPEKETLAGEAASITERRRRGLIIDASFRHAENEADAGRHAAIEKAVADLIGASQFLAQRLGKDRASRVVAAVLEAVD